MGFSPIGLIISVIILLPSLLLLFFPPRRRPREKPVPSRLARIAERAGQALCVLVPIFSEVYIRRTTLDAWFFLMLACIAVYYLLFWRYLSNGREYRWLYAPLGILPIPMAIVPIFAFAFAAMWMGCVWLFLALILFAGGHLPICWQAFQALEG